MNTPLTIAYGDEDFPAYIDAALMVLREAGAAFSIETIEIGSRIYGMNYGKGILPSSFDSLERTRRLLIGGSNLPQKEGYVPVARVIRDHFGLGDEHHDEYGLSVDDDTVIRAVSYVNDNFAMFEAVDETPASALLAATMLLEHSQQQQAAAAIKTAMLHTLKTGIAKPTLLARLLGRSPSEALLFAETVCSHLGKKPSESAASGV